MKNLLSSFLIIITLTTYSQDLSKIQSQIDSLKKVKKEYESKIQFIDLRIKDLEERKTSSQFEKVESLDYPIAQQLQIKIRDKDNSSGKIIYEPKNGENLKLVDFNDDNKYWTVSYMNKIGYVNEIFIQNNLTISEFKKSILLKKSREETVDKSIREKERQLRLIKKYGTSDAERIFRGQYWIGMTDEMAKESLGKPDNLNRSVGSWGTHEQWIYESRTINKTILYLYFENGTLTSFQN